ncbi:alpha/beta fold hydrolase [Salinimonas profundi]|uniref:alpha/beta fold hydrolase n=1 Tax=Salinimonas profundi TaxID=2729140 RepID=UPI001CC27FFB|nr:alpha/beta fold hydrolase [Salinimonas profundi]
MPISLNYEITRSAPAHPWLILIHGLFGNLDNLAVVRRHFQKSCNVVSIDLPDHGESPHTQGFSFEACAEGVATIIEKTEADQVYLLGHSLGGKAAMITALHYPALIRALVVADIAPVTYPAQHNAIIRGLRAVDLSDVEKRSDADKQLAQHIAEPGIRQFLLKSLYQDNDGHWQWRFNLEGIAAHYDTIRSWPETDLEFSKDTLFIKGSRSDYLSSEYRSDVMRLFPTAKARVIDGAGHWLHAEKPEAFNLAVERFLSGVAP